MSPFVANIIHTYMHAVVSPLKVTSAKDSDHC